MHLRSQDGAGEVRKIKLGEKPAFYSALEWSPDSKKVLYQDNHLHLWYIDVEDKKPVLVDTETFGDELAPCWSTDSKWVAYTKQLPSHMSAVFLYSLTNSTVSQITDGMSRARVLYSIGTGSISISCASTDVGPSSEQDVGNFSRPVSYSAYVMVLSKEQASPFAPESDDEKKKDADKNKVDDNAPFWDWTKLRNAKKTDKDKADGTQVKIDLDNIGQRILSLPLPPRRYVGIAAGKPGIIFVVEAPSPMIGGRRRRHDHRYDLNKRKGDIALRGVQQFTVSFNGEKMLYQQGDKWTISAAADNSDAKELKTGDLEVHVDPAAEWKQMYHEAWRIVRDFFYDPELSRAGSAGRRGEILGLPERNRVPRKTSTTCSRRCWAS